MKKYVAPKPLTRAEAIEALRSTSPAETCQALIDIAYFEPDGVWALEQALAFTHDPNDDVANAATTAIGHLARIHRDLDMSAAIARLNELKKDDRFKLSAKYALEDIEVFRR